MRRALAVLALSALVLTGCADTDDGSTGAEPSASESGTPSETATTEGSATPTEEPSDQPSESEAIEIEIEGERIQPNGMRVKVGVGETITLDVDSDRAAEFHVHSSPEQTLEVEPGESTLTLTIERPGLVDVEEHDTGLVVLQLEVR